MSLTPALVANRSLHALPHMECFWHPRQQYSPSTCWKAGREHPGRGHWGGGFGRSAMSFFCSFICVISTPDVMTGVRETVEFAVEDFADRGPRCVPSIQIPNQSNRTVFNSVLLGVFAFTR